MLNNARNDPSMPAVGELLANAERELARKQKELDELAMQMGEEGSRGIHQVNRGGRNATTENGSHTGSVSQAYARHETDGGGGGGGGGQSQKNHGRNGGAREQSGQGGVAGFDTMDTELLVRTHTYTRSPTTI